MGRRTVVGAFVKSTWTNMNIRCGKYRHLGTRSKCKSYDHVTIKFTRDEFKHWCWSNKDLIESLNRPSIDRIDSNGDYELFNIRIIELSDNVKQKRMGNRYLNGPLSNVKRGVRKTKNGKFTARINYNKKEIHIGTFLTEIEAFNAFKTKYIELHDRNPWEDEDDLL